jgi:hypothetical protein
MKTDGLDATVSDLFLDPFDADWQEESLIFEGEDEEIDGSFYSDGPTPRLEYDRFHTGKLGRCPLCGRKIFLPCLACLAEIHTGKLAVARHSQNESDFQNIELDLRGPELRRYESICRQREQAY